MCAIWEHRNLLLLLFCSLLCLFTVCPAADPDSEENQTSLGFWGTFMYNGMNSPFLWFHLPGLLHTWSPSLWSRPLPGPQLVYSDLLSVSLSLLGWLVDVRSLTCPKLGSWFSCLPPSPRSSFIFRYLRWWQFHSSDFSGQKLCGHFGLFSYSGTSHSVQQEVLGGLPSQ